MKTGVKSILFSKYNNDNDNKNLIDNLIYNKSFNPSKVLSDIRQMNSNTLVVVQLNANSQRN